MGRKCAFLPLFVAAISLAFLVLNVSSSAAYYRKPIDKVVKGKYIVVLENDGARETSARTFTDKFFSQAGRKGLSPTQVYEHGINGFAAELSDDDLEIMQNQAGVKFIEEDSVVSINCSPPPPPPPPPPPGVPSWGLDRIDQRDLPLDDVNSPVFQGDGRGVHIYVIDTGTSKTHDEFSGRLFDNQGFDVFNEDIGLDCNGHGTHVAGTAAGATYGVAKQASVHSVRVLDCRGSGTVSGVISGIDWVAGNHQTPAVASMSLGGGFSESMNAAVEGLIAKGVVVSVAAGNEGTDACDYSPSSAPNALTVGATSITDKIASFSNLGGCLDIFAPGVDIKSAWIRSNSATETISGTSMSCPHVSGAAAILLGNDGTLSPADVTAKLIELSTKNKVTGSIGSSPNRLLYIGKTDDNGGGDNEGDALDDPDCRDGQIRSGKPAKICP